MIELVMPALAAATLLVNAGTAVLLWLGNRTIEHLENVEPAADPLPKVSVVVAARNEARGIEAGVRSLLQLDYAPLELVIVNDRSTDATGAILERLAAAHPELRVIQIDALPDGWLGKNHALAVGAGQTDGEFILFTDADVVMAPGTLRRAMGYVTQNEIDHLPMMFRVEMPSWLMRSFVVAFCLYFWAWFRPWKAKDPRSSAYVGAGGFNLIRAAAYRDIGGYEAIRLRPDDDVKLGKLVKQHGYRQDILIATRHVSVPWYRSFSELVHGLEKNAFSGTDYSIALTVGSSAMALLCHVFPFVALLITSGAAWWLYLAVVGTLLATCWVTARELCLGWKPVFGFPLAVLLFVAIQWRTMILNLWRGGIVWRDTFYPLRELKANKV